MQAAVGTEDDIRTEEPADVGVVVSGVEVVPAGFHVVVISPVSERIDVGDVGCIGGHIVARAIGYLPVVSPSVVHILRDKGTCRVADAHNIPLQVFVVPVFRSVVLHPDDRAGRVVGIVNRSYDFAYAYYNK